MAHSHVLFYSQWFWSVLISIRDNFNFVIKKLQRENNNLENIVEKKWQLGEKNRNDIEMRKNKPWWKWTGIITSTCMQNLYWYENHTGRKMSCEKNTMAKFLHTFRYTHSSSLMCRFVYLTIVILSLKISRVKITSWRM